MHNKNNKFRKPWKVYVEKKNMKLSPYTNVVMNKKKDED
jgi:hypothetical protein